MNYLSLTSLSLSTLLLTACASQTGWQPTVDTFNDPNAYRLNQDMAECQELAKHASGGTVKETLVGAGVGALWVQLLERWAVPLLAMLAQVPPLVPPLVA